MARSWRLSPRSWPSRVRSARRLAGGNAHVGGHRLAAVDGDTAIGRDGHLVVLQRRACRPLDDFAVAIEGRPVARTRKTRGDGLRVVVKNTTGVGANGGHGVDPAAVEADHDVRREDVE